MDFASPLLALPLAASLLGAPVAQMAPQSADEPEPAPPAQQPEDPKLERAMESYELGKKAYNAARYEDALGHFQEAATRYASADFQYNIGLCYERLGQPEEAIRAFRTYLRSKPDANDRANVEDRIFDLEKQIADAANQPEPEPEPLPEPEPEQPAVKPSRPLIITGAVLAGVGGAVALGGGVGFGFAARSKSLQVEDVVSGGNPDGLTLSEAQQLEDDGRRLETLQVVMAATGAAVAITGVALLVVGLRRKKEASAGSSTALVPTWTGRAAGLSLTGRF